MNFLSQNVYTGRNVIAEKRNQMYFSKNLINYSGSRSPNYSIIDSLFSWFGLTGLCNVNEFWSPLFHTQIKHTGASDKQVGAFQLFPITNKHKQTWIDMLIPNESLVSWPLNLRCPDNESVVSWLLNLRCLDYWICGVLTIESAVSWPLNMRCPVLWILSCPDNWIVGVLSGFLIIESPVSW